jgi:hypothetical protein
MLDDPIDRMSNGIDPVREEPEHEERDGGERQSIPTVAVDDRIPIVMIDRRRAKFIAVHDRLHGLIRRL